MKSPQLYKLVFHSESDNFGEVEKYVWEGSDNMACVHASKLLQSESNTMFHTIEVWGPFVEGQDEWDGVPAVIELVTTRRTKRREL